MSDPFAGLFPPLDADGAASWYRENVVGTYTSNWAFLRAAAASNFISSARAVWGIIEAAKRGSEKGIRAAEVSSVLSLNWKLFASGPLLSATITPAFAIEAFIRFFAEISIKRTAPSLETLQLALGRFENLGFAERIRSARELSGAAEFPKELNRSLSALIEFRNAVAHDLPHVHDRFGTFMRVKRGSIGRVDEATIFGGLYPLLNTQTMPLDISHAKRAIDTHDELVEHFQTTSDSDCFDQFMASFGSARETSLRIKDLGGAVWKQAEALSEAWQSLLEWEGAIPSEEHESYMRDLLRQQMLREV